MVSPDIAATGTQEPSQRKHTDKSSILASLIYLKNLTKKEKKKKKRKRNKNQKTQQQKTKYRILLRFMVDRFYLQGHKPR